MYSTRLGYEQPAAHETKDPEHRLAGTSLQSISEVAYRVSGRLPKTGVTHEEQYGREDEDGAVEDQQRQPLRHRDVGSREQRDCAELRHCLWQLHCRHCHAEERQRGK